MSREEYDNNKEAWETSKDSVTIQLAVVGSDMCIAFVDRNKLIQITCIPFYPTTSASGTWTWYDKTLAPCPIMDFPAFRANYNLPLYQQALRNPNKTTTIYSEIAGSKNNKLWNGIGTSHAVEILHKACIHPEEKTYTIFQTRPPREKLLQAIEDFFAQVLLFFLRLIFKYLN